MANRKKDILLSLIPAAVSLLLMIGVLTVFSACGLKEDGTWMRCHNVQTAIAVCSAVTTVILCASALIRINVIRIILNTAAFISSGVAFFLPGTIMPMCMMHTMRCYTVMQPFVWIMTSVTAVLGALQIVRAVVCLCKKKRDPEQKDLKQEKPSGKKKRIILIISISAFVCAVTAGIIIWISASGSGSASAYEKAVRLLNAGETDSAYKAFQELGSYRDSAEKAEELVRKDPALPYRNAEKEDIVTFGSYEQNNVPSDGKEPIEWIVLDRIGDEVLLISSKCLDCRTYDDTAFEPVTWEDSDIRKWLNNDFYELAFTGEEQKLLTVSDNGNPDQSVVGTPGGKDTDDYVYLLGEKEAGIYLGNEMDQEFLGTAYATEYALAHGAHTDETGLAEWWLRSPGAYEYTAQFVQTSGAAYIPGAYVDVSYGIRPVVRLNVGSESEGR